MILCLLNKLLKPLVLSRLKRCVKGTPLGRAKVLRAEENRWYLYPQCSDVLSFEAKLLILLEEFSLQRDQYFAIRDKISGIVRAAHYEYNGWPEGWGLD